MTFRVKTGKLSRPMVWARLISGVPIGALDETNCDAAVQLLGQHVEPVNHERGTVAIGLHDHAEAIPALERRIGQDLFNDIEGQIKTIHFLGIDVEAHVGRAGQQGETEGARGQLGENAFLLAHFIARVQGGELDRDAGVLVDRIRLAEGRKRGDRIGIGEVILAGVIVGAGRFAKHVIGIGVTLLLHALGAVGGPLDVGAEHELAAELLHGLSHGGANHRLAHALDRMPCRVLARPSSSLVLSTRPVSIKPQVEALMSGEEE